MIGYICEHCGKGISENDKDAIEITLKSWKRLNSDEELAINKLKAPDISGNTDIHYCGECASDFCAEWLNNA